MVCRSFCSRSRRLRIQTRQANTWVAMTNGPSAIQVQPIHSSCSSRLPKAPEVRTWLIPRSPMAHGRRRSGIESSREMWRCRIQAAAKVIVGSKARPSAVSAPGISRRASITRAPPKATPTSKSPRDKGQCAGQCEGRKERHEEQVDLAVLVLVDVESGGDGDDPGPDPHGHRRARGIASQIPDDAAEGDQEETLEQFRHAPNSCKAHRIPTWSREVRRRASALACSRTAPRGS